MDSTKKINCPHCGKPVDVNELLSKKVKEMYEEEFQLRLKNSSEQIEAKQKELDSLKVRLEQEKNKVAETISAGVTEKIKIEKSKMEKTLRTELQNEIHDQIHSYQQQLNEKSNQLKDQNKLKAEFEKLLREKNELKDSLEAQMQIRLSHELKEAKAKYLEESEKIASLKLAEKEIVINQLKDQLQSAHKKAVQGSQQLQGEAQEIMIEAFLKENFPMDEIEGIKKGVKGGDTIHQVKNSAGDLAGLIYYESKRTNSFQAGWLEKFRSDVREKKATFGVLITDAYPKNMSRLGQRNGIWICSYSEFQSLCHVLRESVLLLHQATVSQENKGGKMEMLYHYLTSKEFTSHVEAIIEGFTQMTDDLGKERRAMEGLWKIREKQLQNVLISTSRMYHSVKGIAGKAVPSIKELEFNEPQRLLTKKKK